MSDNISQHHTNRRHHNWLVYNISDRFLLKLSKYYKGVMYDFGCGEAPYRGFFEKFVDRYVGVDWTNSIHNTKVEIVADLNKDVPIQSAVADTIISLSVMEHLNNPQKMLNEAYRVLKPGGYFILQVPWQWRVHEAPHDYFRYTPYALKNMLEKAGFSSISVLPSSGFFTTWLIKFNYFTLTFINWQKRLVRGVLKLIFIPIWYLNQWLAPVLDKLDEDWEQEAQGYFVVTKKKL